MKYFLFFLTIFIISLFIPRLAEASLANVNESSVKNEIIKMQERNDKIKTLRAFLAKQNSELEPYAEDIVLEAERNGLPYHLLVAISGAESTFCKFIPFSSYNCWGWANGEYSFKDYPDAIKIISKALGEKYFARGLDTPEKISPVYAPPSTTWARNVRYFMNKIEISSLASL